jgi:hypothetical protein
MTGADPNPLGPEPAGFFESGSVLKNPINSVKCSYWEARRIDREASGMRKSAFNSAEKFFKQWATVSYLLVATIVLAIDYITGRHIQFPITYVLPVGMAAWLEQKPAAYAMAILLPFMRVGFHLPWHETQSFSVAVVNAFIAVSALILYAYLVDRIAWQTKALEKKVRVLEGILPICASCKRIRTEKGEYAQIEKYITEHSEASFSHGLCPECAKKLYPEYFNEDQG